MPSATARTATRSPEEEVSAETKSDYILRLPPSAHLLASSGPPEKRLSFQVQDHGAAPLLKEHEYRNLGEVITD